MSEAADRMPGLIVVSPHNPSDIRAWSGTMHRAYGALKDANPDIEYVTSSCTDCIFNVLTRILAKLGFCFYLGDSVVFSLLAGLETSVRLAGCRGDIIVAIAAKSHVAFVRTSRPILYVSDATYACIVKLYSYYALLPNWTKRHQDILEGRALRASSAIVYSSEWARESAVKDYGIAPQLITVLPFGPNIDADTIDRYETVKQADFSNGIRLLFVAAEWARKGGPTVLEVKRILDERGFHCELTLVGACAPEVRTGNGVQVVGTLQKQVPEQLLALCRLYEQAHFLILPTSAEAFGVVFSEAQAFGCPALTYAVGGTTTAVIDGRTGFTLPLGASASDFADLIEGLIRDPERYRQLSAASRARYETEANWREWARQVVKLAERLKVGLLALPKP